MRKMLLVFVLALFCGGCATVVHGTKQKVRVDSNPPGARVTIDQEMSVVTPYTVELRRKQEHDLEIKREGYGTQTVHLDKNISLWYFGNVILTGTGIGLISWIWDAVNGAMWKLSPEEVSVNLEPGEGVAPATARFKEEPAAPSPPAAKAGTYTPPEVELPDYEGEKTFVAVMDFEAKVGMSPDQVSLLSEKMRTAVFDTGIFRVVDRKNMEKLLEEQGFQLSDLANCSSTECAVRVGRMIGVGKMVLGSVGKLGEKFVITVQLVNVESGEIESVAGEECFCQLSDLTLATEVAVRRLARKLIK